MVALSAEAAVFLGGLGVVVGLAKALVVLRIPELMLIALVWHDVIHDGCGHVSALFFAVDAQGMSVEKLQPISLPLAAVTTLGGFKSLRRCCGDAEPCVSWWPDSHDQMEIELV